MRRVFDVIRYEPRARAFLLAHVQSSLGTGAATVALVVIAYDRWRSPWAITLVLLANFLPSMFLGPLFGAAADRWSRRWCAVVADLIQAAAFVGLALVDSFPATVAFALLAGVGVALWSPAVLAALPGMVSPERLPAATSLYGSVKDLGRTIGPLLAAIAFALVGADVLMIANSVTFLISAAVLAALPFGARTAPAARGMRAMLREAREGLVVTTRTPGVRVVVWASTAIVLFAATLNVAELLLARDLGVGPSGFAVLLTALGVGVVAGSVWGASGSTLDELKRRYIGGLLIVGLGLVAMAVAPHFAIALPAFLLMGFGNGVVVVHERLLVQATMPDSLMGRAFAVLDTTTSWAFALAFIGAGAAISLIGTRGLLGIAGAASVAVWLYASVALRGVWNERTPVLASRETAEALTDG
jgi:MFS family permease